MIFFRKAEKVDAKTYVDLFIHSKKETYAGFAKKKNIDINKVYDRDKMIHSFLENLKDEEIHTYIIEYQNKVAGILEFGKPDKVNIYKEGMKNYGELRTLHIKNEYQNLKIGSCAMEFMLNKSKKYKNFFLWTKKDNRKAIEFYKKHGFVENGYHCEDSSDGIPSLVMERSL